MMAPMPIYTSPDTLYHLALLYFRIAHGGDGVLSDAELQHIVERLHAKNPALPLEDVHEIAFEALTDYSEAEDGEQQARDAVGTLQLGLTAVQKASVVVDLEEVARADGIVLDRERALLNDLALDWGLAAAAEGALADRQGEPAWGYLHDLAFLYLVLAHGTDNELSTREQQVILNKLREWSREPVAVDVDEVFDMARARYAAGPEEADILSAIEGIRSQLPLRQRMAALNDLVKIANADGLFLDNEEDMINNLLTAWEIDPYANYENDGSKLD